MNQRDPDDLSKTRGGRNSFSLGAIIVVAVLVVAALYFLLDYLGVL